MSIRARLTLLGAVTIAAALLTLSLTTTSATARTLGRRDHEALAAVATALIPSARNQVQRSKEGRRPLPFRPSRESPLRQTFVGFGVVVLADGTQLPLPRLATDDRSTPQLPANVLDRKGGDFDVRAPDGTPFIARVDKVPETDAVVFTALSVHDTHATIADLRRTMLVSGITLVVAFAVLSAVATRIGLRPLRAISSAASRIGRGSTGERIPVTRAGSEVATLTDALNTMLEEVEVSAAAREHALARTRQFAADAAHELRTPVTSIMGYAELLHSGSVSGEGRLTEVYGRICGEATRMREIVEDLLLLDRLGPQALGRQAIVEAVDVAEIAREVAADSVASDPDHPVTVIDDGSPRASAARDEVFRILSNLVANVRAHTPPGTAATITVSVQDDRTVRTEVSDDGPGIPEEHQDRIFERFHRVDPSRSRRGGSGSGLGLAIVAGLAAANGGSAELVGSDPAGTTFAVSLPPAEPAGPGR